MSVNFDKAIPVILNHEGGYVNNPNDPGGETNYGICKRSYPNVDIKNLTKEGAIEIYHRDFWLAIYDRIIESLIATKTFDMGVNMGTVTTHKIVQRAAGVSDDGVFGEGTLAAVNGIELATLLDKIKSEQSQHYLNLIERNPKLEVFKNNWLSRADWPKNDTYIA